MPRKEADALQNRLLAIGCTFPGVSAVGEVIAKAVGDARWADGTCGQQPLCLVGSPAPEPIASDLDVVMLEKTAVGVPLVCDAAEPVQLGLSEFALAPCRESGSGGSEPRQGQVVANGAACVRAVQDTGAGPRQLMIIGNLDQASPHHPCPKKPDRHC